MKFSTMRWTSKCYNNPVWLCIKNLEYHGFLVVMNLHYLAKNLGFDNPSYAVAQGDKARMLPNPLIDHHFFLLK